MFITKRCLSFVGMPSRVRLAARDPTSKYEQEADSLSPSPSLSRSLSPSQCYFSSAGIEKRGFFYKEQQEELVQNRRRAKWRKYEEEEKSSPPPQNLSTFSAFHREEGAGV